MKSVRELGQMELAIISAKVRRDLIAKHGLAKVKDFATSPIAVDFIKLAYIAVRTLIIEEDER